jgi:hypothetical protein
VAEGHAPVVAVLVASELRRPSPFRPPKGTDSGPLWLFPCKPAVFRGPPEGAMIATVVPGRRRRAGGRRPFPVVAVLLASAKGRGPRTPVAFSLQTGRFQGTTKGTMIGLCGPPYRPGRRCARGEGHAPVRAVLVTSAKADEPIFVPKGRRPRTTKAFSSCKCAPFEGTADGTVGDIWLPLARCCCLRRSVPRETQRRRRARVMPGQSGRH